MVLTVGSMLDPHFFHRFPAPGLQKSSHRRTPQRLGNLSTACVAAPATPRVEADGAILVNVTATGKVVAPPGSILYNVVVEGDTLVLVLEHILVMLKFFLAWVVPDTPSWLVAAQARKEFHAQRRAREEYQSQVEQGACVPSDGSGSKEGFDTKYMTQTSYVESPPAVCPWKKVPTTVRAFDAAGMEA